MQIIVVALENCISIDYKSVFVVVFKKQHNFTLNFKLSQNFQFQDSIQLLKREVKTFQLCFPNFLITKK